MSAWRPMTAQQWADYQRMTALLDDSFPRVRDEAEVIRRNSDWLIQYLYDPNEEVGARQSRRTMELGMYDEAINWGDLKVVDVERTDDGWHIVIDEAAPDSTGLCSYVAEWLRRWGWPDVEVETEW